jgi:hypothetical protein
MTPFHSSIVTQTIPRSGASSDSVSAGPTRLDTINRSYPARVGNSCVEYRGCGFWTRDAALETALGLLVVELQPLAEGDDQLSAVLDWWTLQATVGFIGCVSPDLDNKLADPGLRSVVAAGARRMLARLPAHGLVPVRDVAFIQRAERVTAGGPWRSPEALAVWVIEVGNALLQLIEGDLPATPDDFWFVDGAGRRKVPRIRHDTKLA